MDLVVVFLAWLAGMLAVPIIADARGRSGGGFFLLALVSTPLFAWAVVVSLPDLTAAKQRKQEHEELIEALSRAVPASPSVPTTGATQAPTLQATAAPQQIASRKGEGWSARNGVEWPVAVVVAALVLAVVWASMHAR